jgi:hypothetical protein
VAVDIAKVDLDIYGDVRREGRIQYGDGSLLILEETGITSVKTDRIDDHCANL